jgi:zinc/manganese transport system substrate-binding protein
MGYHAKGPIRHAAVVLVFLQLATSGAFGESGSGGVLEVVAAENFYGSIAEQVGGGRVSVRSILTDPNVDPHEYESSVNDAKAIARADLVIQNGGGYDDWMDRLLAASPRGSRVVLKGYDLAVRKLPDNEHVWYSLDNAEAVAAAIASSLTHLSPSDGNLFSRNLSVFRRSLADTRGLMARMKDRWGGTRVGLTETIFLYQTEPLGLTVLTPLELQKAVAEGNDAPADAVVRAERQVRERRIRVLIYNEQTVSATTTRLLDEARRAGIPVVSVTETMPSTLSYQGWMLSQLVALDKALGR